MNKVFLARFPDRVTLSKRPGLDLAQGALVGELMSMNISYAKRSKIPITGLTLKAKTPPRSGNRSYLCGLHLAGVLLPL